MFEDVNRTDHAKQPIHRISIALSDSSLFSACHTSPYGVIRFTSERKIRGPRRPEGPLTREPWTSTLDWAFFREVTIREAVFGQDQATSRA
jgi:hypothetical protein